MATLQERIQQAAQKLEELKKAQRLAAAKERAAQSKQQRALDTRRKIIAGGHYLSKVSEEHYQNFVNGLPERDKAVFDGFKPQRSKDAKINT